MYYYLMNCRLTETNETNFERVVDGEVLWNGTVMMPYRELLSPHWAKDIIGQRLNWESIQFIPDAGWHFSFLGDAESIAGKLESFAHAEFNTAFHKDVNRIADLISSGRDLFGREDKKYSFTPIDDSYPKYVIENPEMFKKYIKGV